MLSERSTIWANPPTRKKYSFLLSFLLCELSPLVLTQVSDITRMLSKHSTIWANQPTRRRFFFFFCVFMLIVSTGPHTGFWYSYGTVQHESVGWNRLIAQRVRNELKNLKEKRKWEKKPNIVSARFRTGDLSRVRRAWWPLHYRNYTDPRSFLVSTPVLKFCLVTDRMLTFFVLCVLSWGSKKSK